jgi:T-complex protein 1 subunit alpha
MNTIHKTKILVELADLQDQEVGDGTTSVVILAAELLRRGSDLVRARVHPTSVIAGYRLAMREVRFTVDERRSRYRKCCSPISQSSNHK